MSVVATRPVMGTLAPEPAAGATTASLVPQLRAVAMRALSRMYRPEHHLFAYRVRLAANKLVLEGTSQRYTAIALIGLAGESETASSAVLAGHTPQEVCHRLIGDVPRLDNLGDVALICWATRVVSYGDGHAVRHRLLELRPEKTPHPTVEVAWALSALCADGRLQDGELAEGLARRLVASSDERSGVFAHITGGNAARPRSHIACFADLVYPILALASYGRLSGDREALDAALRSADRIRRCQGPAGQWWWHYDRRSGQVVEPYPVYAVHQDAMAPMALFALQEATGTSFSRPIARGLEWLATSPELGGGSLIDQQADLIWRKVGRREPGKLSRYVQAAASRVHPSLRAPGLDFLFPARNVDYEDRPYHLGWLLYAWPRARAARWAADGSHR